MRREFQIGTEGMPYADPNILVPEHVMDRRPGWVYWPATAKEGRHEVEVVMARRTRGKGLPEDAVLVGDFFIRDRFYARFVEVRLSDGRSFPFCAEIFERRLGLKGAPFLPESKPGDMKVWQLQDVKTSFTDH